MNKSTVSSPRSAFVTEQIFAHGKEQELFEAEILPAYFCERRWFAGKARAPQRFAIEESVPLGAAQLLVVRVTYRAGETESYLLPVRFVDNPPSEPCVIARGGGRVLIEATHDPHFRDDLLRLMAQGGVVRSQRAQLRGIAGPAMCPVSELLDSKLLAVEQSNTSIVYADRIFLKLYRKLEEGINPDAEITRFLSERQQFAHVPPFAGALELHDAERGVRVLGLALGLVANHGDAWTFTLKELDAFFSRVRTLDTTAPLPLGDYADAARQLGVRTGQLHCALAADASDPLFAPESFTLAEQRELADAIRQAAAAMFGLLRAHTARDSEEARLIEALFRSEELIDQRTRALELREIGVTKTRTHGDYHLGQVLHTGADFVIIDFEGEPLRPLVWRKRKRSPLRDVAGMLRSFDYATHSALAELSGKAKEPGIWAGRWREAVSALFLQGWREAAGARSFVPTDADDWQTLLDAFLLEKVIYEISYELNNRPAWLPIPARGLVRLLEAC